jgi:hypothetical protein
MSKHMAYLRKKTEADAIRTCAEAMGLAVALTADELITARGGFLGRGGRLDRYPLSAVTGIRALPNPHASLLEVELSDKRSITFMYERCASADFERLAQMLRVRISGAEAPAPMTVAAAEPVSVPPVGGAATMQEGGEESTRLNRIVVAVLLVPLIALYFYQIVAR